VQDDGQTVKLPSSSCDLRGDVCGVDADCVEFRPGCDTVEAAELAIVEAGS